jgi:hypothetical protein
VSGVAEATRASWARLVGRLDWWFLDGEKALYGVAAARIVTGLGIVLFVLANASTASYTWGGASDWSAPLSGSSEWGFPFVAFAGAQAGGPAFWLGYVALGVSALALLVGWHGRIAAVVTLWLYAGLTASNPIAVDQTDNAVRLFLFYFCFADLSRVWSLDARRRGRREARGHKAVGSRSHLITRLRDEAGWVPTLLHNAALVAVAGQLFVVYVIAGLSKVQGELWRDGTAIYYPLHVDRFAPWPALSGLLTASGVLVAFATWFAVAVQLFFPFLLLRRWTRVVGLLGVSAMHIGIGLFMGLPLFSLAMLAADMIFIRTVTFQRAAVFVAARSETVRARVTRSRGGIGELPEGAPSDRTSPAVT